MHIERLKVREFRDLKDFEIRFAQAAQAYWAHPTRLQYFTGQHPIFLIWEDSERGAACNS